MAYFEHCWICEETVPPRDPAIGVTGLENKPTFFYVPFVEDLRTTMRLAHLRCFAQESGVDALIELVHERDIRVRLEMWALLDSNERLRQRWRGQGPDAGPIKPEGE